MKKILFISCFFLLVMNPIFATKKFTDKDLQNKLKDLAQKTDKIVITYISYIADKNPQKVELKGKDIQEFFSLLKLKMPENLYYDMCYGQLKIILYSKTKELSSLTYHHGRSIRGKFIPLRSNIDIVPTFQEKLKSFFIKHGLKADKLK